MYQFGFGTNSDLLKAAKIYQEADDNNGSSACNYARMVQQHDFLDTVENVVTWYEKAVDKSNTRAMYNLALMYIKGDGVEHNYEKAVSLLNQALEKQSPQAQLLMAIAYKSGFMVKKDKKQSKVLIRKVDNSGKRFFLYSWYLTFANKNMVINADYIPNQIAPESEVQLGRVRGLTFNENEAINPYRDLESYIYHIARKYLLQLNETKLFSSRVPFILDGWLNETNGFTNRMCDMLFTSKEEQKAYVEKISAKEDDAETPTSDVLPYLLKSHVVRYGSKAKQSIMNQLNELICNYPNKDRTIIAYFLSSILNHIGKNKDKCTIFKNDVKGSTVFSFLDLTFYAYSFFPIMVIHKSCYK